MHATPTTAAALLPWPALCPAAGGSTLVTNDAALGVCAELERRVRLLDQFRLPWQVAQDVDEMARDIGELQALLLLPAQGEPAATHRAGRLLADLQAWLPVCEAWIGSAGPAPREWPRLAS